MKNEKTRNAFFLVGSTLLGALGQLFFKYSFTSNLFVEWLAVGILVYGFSTVIYFYVLSRVHLSWAYGIGGLSYIFATFLAYFVLAESIPPLRWAGVVIITIGVVLIGLS
ncbi:MAG TPA: hypothetical protein VL944_02685 [Candidatus Acidoferrum sp.]|nr:hypothetical protein [Candidatus Acidoferrum sp.]